MSEIKYATNKTKDWEPLVTDNSVINALRNFKLFQCSKTFLKNIDATYEQARMSNLQENGDTAKLRYGWACMLEKKGDYYMELSNTITTFNDNNNTPLLNVKI